MLWQANSQALSTDITDRGMLLKKNKKSSPEREKDMNLFILKQLWYDQRLHYYVLEALKGMREIAVIELWLF